MAPKLKFIEGEKVLCFHGPLIYEAKALKSQITKDKQVKYFIHYAGWNKNWDEWVPESRVLKYNEANVQRQTEVLKQHATVAAKNKKDKSTTSKIIQTKLLKLSISPVTCGQLANFATSTPATITTNQIMKTKTIPNCIDDTNDSDSESNTSIKFPDELKRWLVTEVDIINKLYKVHEIPSRINVQDILEKYVEDRKADNTIDESNELAIVTLSLGLIEYFDALLSAQLLYKYERPQHIEMLALFPDMPMSKLYGSFHLLRMFSRLEAMMSFSSLDEESLQQTLLHINDFLQYMAKNCDSLFSLDNFVPSTYHIVTL